MSTPRSPGRCSPNIAECARGVASAGGVEAALTAALLSYGVDNASAAGIVLLFRILTFWLPTLPGYLFLQYTQRKGIV